MRIHPVISVSLTVLISSAHAVAGQGATAPKAYDDAPSAPSKDAGPRVTFKNLKNRAVVPTEFTVEFELRDPDMKLHPAGKLVPKTGHHHLIINGKPVPKGQVVPANKTHLHFGTADVQSGLPPEKTTLKLEPGQYMLTLQFADGAHVSYGPDYSETISIRVQHPAQKAAQEDAR